MAQQSYRFTEQQIIIRFFNYFFKGVFQRTIFLKETNRKIVAGPDLANTLDREAIRSLMSGVQPTTCDPVFLIYQPLFLSDQSARQHRRLYGRDWSQ